MNTNNLIEELSADLIKIARCSSYLINKSDTTEQDIVSKYIYASSLKSLRSIINYKKLNNKNNKTD